MNSFISDTETDKLDWEILVSDLQSSPMLCGDPSVMLSVAFVEDIYTEQNVPPVDAAQNQMETNNTMSLANLISINTNTESALSANEQTDTAVKLPDATDPLVLTQTSLQLQQIPSKRRQRKQTFSKTLHRSEETKSKSKLKFYEMEITDSMEPLLKKKIIKAKKSQRYHKSKKTDLSLLTKQQTQHEAEIMELKKENMKLSYELRKKEDEILNLKQDLQIKNEIILKDEKVLHNIVETIGKFIKLEPKE